MCTQYSKNKRRRSRKKATRSDCSGENEHVRTGFKTAHMNMCARVSRQRTCYMPHYITHGLYNVACRRNLLRGYTGIRTNCVMGMAHQRHPKLMSLRFLLLLRPYYVVYTPHVCVWCVYKEEEEISLKRVDQ